jgi:hypothetical protein
MVSTVVLVAVIACGEQPELSASVKLGMSEAQCRISLVLFVPQYP